MAVDVDVEDAGDVAEHLEDAEYDVVDVAEAGRYALLVVIEPACAIYGDFREAFHETVGGGHSGA